MPWRGHNGTECKGCGRPTSEVGSLSVRYKCAGCGEGRMIENYRQLTAHAGPHFDYWRRQCVAAFGAIMPSDTDTAERGSGDRADDR